MLQVALLYTLIQLEQAGHSVCPPVLFDLCVIHASALLALSAVLQVALAHKGKLVMVTVNMDGTSKDPVVNFFGVKAEDAPVVVGFEMAKNRKYKLQGEAK